MPRLIGLGFVFSQTGDHGGRLAAKGGMRAFSVIELDPSAGTCLGFRSGLSSMLVDTFVYQRPPQAFDKDIVEEPAFAIHPLTGRRMQKSMLPRGEMRTPDSRSLSVQAKDVNWLPCPHS